MECRICLTEHEDASRWKCRMCGETLCCNLVNTAAQQYFGYANHIGCRHFMEGFTAYADPVDPDSCPHTEIYARTMEVRVPDADDQPMREVRIHLVAECERCGWPLESGPLGADGEKCFVSVWRLAPRKE